MVKQFDKQDLLPAKEQRLRRRSWFALG